MSTYAGAEVTTCLDCPYHRLGGPKIYCAMSTVAIASETHIPVNCPTRKEGVIYEHGNRYDPKDKRTRNRKED